MSEIKFENKKPYSLRFGFPAFPFSYRIFTSYWWRDLIDLPRDIYNMFKFKYQRMMYGLADSDTWDFDTYNAHIQYNFFSKFKLDYICPSNINEEEYKDALNKICDAWMAQIMLLDAYKYTTHCYIKESNKDEVIGKFNKELYNQWREPLQKQWEEGMQLYIKYYDTFSFWS
jgi:hypothetical protein